MPILLTTPKNPGDLDAVSSYTHVELISFRWSNGLIEFSMMYGTMSGNSFVPGKWAPNKHTVSNNPKTGLTEYTDMIAEVTLDGETAFESVGRIIYTFVLAKGIYAGTPVVPQ